ncbi:MAG TPA: DoxX family protein [Caulobacteraceae bacterium]|jgi:uncharacterized membrane protein YphA (DoxX/SURF4 family)
MQDIGRRIFGIGALGMAAISFKFHDFSHLLHPAPGHFPWTDIFAAACDVGFVAGGVAILLGRKIANAGALILAATFFARVLVLTLPPLVKSSTVWGSYEDIAEVTAEALGGVIAWSMLGSGEARARVALIARMVFGVCLIVFGVSDIVYAGLTASFIPKWFPLPAMFWTYVATAAHIAAGLAVLSGIQARLAAILVTVMYAIFQVVVHVPLVLADPKSAAHWIEPVTNVVLLGAAWILAEYLSQTRKKADGR